MQKSCQESHSYFFFLSFLLTGLLDGINHSIAYILSVHFPFSLIYTVYIKKKWINKSWMGREREREKRGRREWCVCVCVYVFTRYLATSAHAPPLRIPDPSVSPAGGRLYNFNSEPASGRASTTRHTVYNRICSSPFSSAFTTLTFKLKYNNFYLVMSYFTGVN